MPDYASGTSVAVSKTVADIERLVQTHGGLGFVYGRDDVHCVARVSFAFEQRQLRFDVPVPQASEYRLTPTGKQRTQSAARQVADAEYRRLWRSLFLVIKALFVAIDDGVLQLSDAFLAYTVLPTGQTLGSWAMPQLDAAATHLPELLPGS